MERTVAKYTLQELRASIRKERGWVNRKPYSHNIISIDLGLIEEHYGLEEANKAIDDFKLTQLGWHKRMRP